jgi:hypothetical protein
MVLESKDYSGMPCSAHKRPPFLWCWRATVTVSESNNYGVRE